MDVDQKTPNAELPLPHPDNDLSDDVLRIRASLQMVDGLLAALASGLDGLTAEGGGLDLNLLPANLRALAALAGAADRLPYFTGAGALSLSTLTAFGRTLLAAGDSASGRVALALGSAATANVTTSATDVTAGRLLRVGDLGGPVNANYRYLPTATGTDNVADFNNLIVPGWFKSLLGGAPADRNPNHPDGLTPIAAGNGVANYYWPLVGRHDGGGMFQLAFPYISAANISKASIKFRMFGAGQWSDWDSLMLASANFQLGPTQASALTALGLTGLPARVAALEGGQTVTALGDVATTGAQTVDLNVTAGKFFTASMATASATGTLTLNFTNVPVSETSIITWHVELIRGARKTLVLQLDGVPLTPTWSGGAAPLLSAAATGRDLLMFYRMPGRATVYAMLVDSGTV
ncbi:MULTISPECIES: pyocin knob domain-containing protein [unclassified Pseudomonas]|uniref:pyocin knob domain-containing protein n=1 Tax=unclassified Pseudomonas TaxID=196821 RepID=UPI00244721BC|nr:MULTISPECIES: pyocin knob domain-containing protein [unclassified Pseudomonas]MDH0894343.1 pyocin knob domain-containing protein [Pseudomonas sp. GD03875]MDH1063362.1 pyocin knob domain-containing protein [Pseudomonas sp. GD03985]